MQIPLFYKHKEIFGLDIGQRTIKLAQLKSSRGKIQVVGYGYSHFDSAAKHAGEIVKPDIIAQALDSLLRNTAVGSVTTNRVALSIPIAHSFTRIMNLPKMPDKDLQEAVRLEAEQYIPVAANQLYIEHLPLVEAPVGKKDTVSLLVVAVPKKIVDSHFTLCEKLGLEIAAVEPTMFADLRSVHFNCPEQVPKIVIDFGAHSSDLAIYDNTVRLTSTIATGGENITETIAKGLNLSLEEAHRIKVRYGISKSRWQVQLASVLQPILSDFTNEVQKAMRYYHNYTDKKGSVTNIFMIGGGANMPGLADFLSHLTGVRVQICNPWGKIVVKPLQPPHPAETTIYATAIGLALRELVP